MSSGSIPEVRIARSEATAAIEAVAKGLGLPMERMFVNVDRYGNTSAASIPIALAEAVDGGRVKVGDNVVMVAFGAGFTWGAMVVRF